MGKAHVQFPYIALDFFQSKSIRIKRLMCVLWPDFWFAQSIAPPSSVSRRNVKTWIMSMNIPHTNSLSRVVLLTTIYNGAYRKKQDASLPASQKMSFPYAEKDIRVLIRDASLYVIDGIRPMIDIDRTSKIELYIVNVVAGPLVPVILNDQDLPLEAIFPPSYRIVQTVVKTVSPTDYNKCVGPQVKYILR